MSNPAEEGDAYKEVVAVKKEAGFDHVDFNRMVMRQERTRKSVVTEQSTAIFATQNWFPHEIQTLIKDYRWGLPLWVLMVLTLAMPPLDIEHCRQYSDKPEDGMNIFVFLLFINLWNLGCQLPFTITTNATENLLGRSISWSYTKAGNAEAPRELSTAKKVLYPGFLVLTVYSFFCNYMFLPAKLSDKSQNSGDILVERDNFGFGFMIYCSTILPLLTLWFSFQAKKNWGLKSFAHGFRMMRKNLGWFGLCGFFAIMANTKVNYETAKANNFGGLPAFMIFLIEMLLATIIFGIVLPAWRLVNSIMLRTSEMGTGYDDLITKYFEGKQKGDLSDVRAHIKSVVETGKGLLSTELDAFDNTRTPEEKGDDTWASDKNISLFVNGKQKLVTQAEFCADFYGDPFRWIFGRLIFNQFTVVGFIVILIRDFFNSWMLFYWRQQEFHIVYTLLSDVHYRYKLKNKDKKGDTVENKDVAMEELADEYIMHWAKSQPVWMTTANSVSNWYQRSIAKMSNKFVSTIWLADMDKGLFMPITIPRLKELNSIHSEIHVYKVLNSMVWAVGMDSVNILKDVHYNLEGKEEFKYKSFVERELVPRRDHTADLVMSLQIMHFSRFFSRGTVKTSSGPVILLANIILGVTNGWRKLDGPHHSMEVMLGNSEYFNRFLLYPFITMICDFMEVMFVLTQMRKNILRWEDHCSFFNKVYPNRAMWILSMLLWVHVGGDVYFLDFKGIVCPL